MRLQRTRNGRRWMRGPCPLPRGACRKDWRMPTCLLPQLVILWQPGLIRSVSYLLPWRPLPLPHFHIAVLLWFFVFTVTCDAVVMTITRVVIVTQIPCQEESVIMDDAKFNWRLFQVSYSIFHDSSVTVSHHFTIHSVPQNTRWSNNAR